MLLVRQVSRYLARSFILFMRSVDFYRYRTYRTDISNQIIKALDRSILIWFQSHYTIGKTTTWKNALSATQNGAQPPKLNSYRYSNLVQILLRLAWRSIGKYNEAPNTGGSNSALWASDQDNQASAVDTPVDQLYASSSSAHRP